MRLGPGQLGAAARVLRRVGLRVEFTGGRQEPPRSGRHAGLVRQVRIALSPFLPEGRVVVEAASVAMTGRGPGGYRTPDLVVCPSRFLRSDDRFLHPQAVDIAVETVTGGAGGREIADVVAWYGQAGVPSVLVLDARAGPGSWALHSAPVAGRYRLTEHGRFGEEIHLRRLGLSLPTGQLVAFTG